MSNNNANDASSSTSAANNNNKSADKQPVDKAAAEDENKKDLQQLGALEEDDEFEEFEIEDWKDEDTDLAQIGASKDKLWEDSWDDDDQDDDFSHQLRAELEKQKNAGTAMVQ